MDLSSYNSANNRYTIPADGYVRTVSGNTANDYAFVYVYGGTQSDTGGLVLRITAKTQVTGYVEANALFVKAGMKVYSLLSGTDSAADYFKLT